MLVVELNPSEATFLSHLGGQDDFCSGRRSAWTTKVAEKTAVTDPQQGGDARVRTCLDNKTIEFV